MRAKQPLSSFCLIADSAPSLVAAVAALPMAIYGALPAVFMGIGALFLYDFPIDRERHAAVRAKLDALVHRPLPDTARPPNQD